MALSLPKVCNMGSSKGGLVGTIGVTLLNPDGTTHTARTTAGIYEIGINTGCYGKDITFPDNWAGALVWDTGGGTPVYAVEEYFVDGKVDSIYDICDAEFDNILFASMIIGEYLHDLWLIQGLDTANPMTVTPTSREVETIRQTISGDGKTTSTITRTA